MKCAIAPYFYGRDEPGKNAPNFSDYYRKLGSLLTIVTIEIKQDLRINPKSVGLIRESTLHRGLDIK
jgi:hypothetical protein